MRCSQSTSAMCSVPAASSVHQACRLVTRPRWQLGHLTDALARCRRYGRRVHAVATAAASLSKKGKTLLRRSILAATLASVLSMLSIGAVFAHECVISSRSTQGDQGATNSKVWGTLQLAEVLDFAFGLNPDQIEWAVDNRGDLPESWVTRMDKTIGEGSANANLADGKGLDHLEDLVGAQVFLLAQAAQEAVPAN
jgi:hypothetical protein